MQFPDRNASAVTLLTTQDVQRLMKVDRSTVYRMAEDGRLPGIKVGRQWRFPEDRLHDWLQRAQGAPAREQVPGLSAALGPAVLQSVSDFLGDAFGAMVVLADLEGRPLAKPSNPCGLFEAAHRYPGALERCVLGWHALAAEVDLDPHWRVTPLGFLCARALVRDAERLVGMIVAGGISPAAWPPDPAESARLAADLDIPAAVFLDHAAEVHRPDAAGRDHILRLLPRAAAFLSRLAADRSRLSGRLGAIAALASETPQRSAP